MRVLCTCLPGHGHFLPMLPLARALVAAGHEVAFSTAEDFCDRIVAAGFPAFPAGIGLDDQIEEARRRYPREDRLAAKERFLSFVPRMLAGVAAPSRAEELVTIARRWRPDLLVHDETEFAGPLAAEVVGIPYADHSLGIFRPLSMARLSAEMLDPLRREMGVDPAPFGGLFRYLYLDVCPPTLQNPEVEHADVAHALQNAFIEEAIDEKAPAWLEDLPPQRTVYVSLGTVFQGRDAFQAVVEGLRDEPYNVIVTVGNQNDPAALGPQPENVHIATYIPQSLLLPACDVVVNQGGTAIPPILAHGLPVLLLPQRANQFHNAEACVAVGVGRHLLPSQVCAAAVRDNVEEVLRNPRHKQRAQAVAKEIDSMPKPEDAVRLLETLARTRRPLVRDTVPR